MFWLYDADKTGKLLNAIHEGLKQDNQDNIDN